MICESQMIEDGDEMGTGRALVLVGNISLSCLLTTCICMNTNIFSGEGQSLCCGCPTIDLEIFCRVRVSYCALSFRGELLAGRAGMFLSCRCLLCCGSIAISIQKSPLKAVFYMTQVSVSFSRGEWKVPHLFVACFHFYIYLKKKRFL